MDVPIEPRMQIPNMNQQFKQAKDEKPEFRQTFLANFIEDTEKKI